MGVFSGGTRTASPPADIEERATYRAPTLSAYIDASPVPVVDAVTANQSVAIRSTSDLIASVTSELPLIHWSSKDRASRRRLPVPSTLEDPGGDGMGLEDWAYRLNNSWLLTGNCFGDVIDADPRSGALNIVDLIGLDQVSATIENGRPKWLVNGREVTTPATFKHWRVNPVTGRLLGLSPIEHHAATIGVSLATTRFGRAWFADGAHPGGLLLNELADFKDDPEAADNAKRRFVAATPGRDPVVLGKGWSFQEIQISPEESQFLQTSGMSEAQCARIFGPGFAEILGYETGQKMTYGNVVERRQDLLVLGLNRWFRRYERVASLFVPRDHVIEVDRDALLESTTLQRYQAYAASKWWQTANEVRAKEGLDAHEGGDTLNSNAAPIPGTEVPSGDTARP